MWLFLFLKLGSDLLWVVLGVAFGVAFLGFWAGSGAVGEDGDEAVGEDEWMMKQYVKKKIKWRLKAVDEWILSSPSLFLVVCGFCKLRVRFHGN